MFSGTFLQVVRKWLAVSTLLILPAVGQTGLGVIRGTVQDPSKAIVPGAKVTLMNVATGLLRISSAKSAGIYYFDAVPIGKNTVTVESPGFKKWESTVSVEAGQTLVIDPAMEVAARAEGCTIEEVATEATMGRYVELQENVRILGRTTRARMRSQSVRR